MLNISLAAGKRLNNETSCSSGVHRHSSYIGTTFSKKLAFIAVLFLLCRVVEMETLMSAVAPRSPAPAKKLSEVDFRSGATLDQLSSQVSELVVLEQGDFGDQTALEVHTAKDFIFNMLGMSLFV